VNCSHDTPASGGKPIEVRVFPVARYPYLVYHRLKQDELIIIHVRDGRRNTPREGEL